MRKSWEVQHGKGARILAQLGKDTQLRARLGVPTSQLRLEAAGADLHASEIIYAQLTELALVAGTVSCEAIIGRLSLPEQRQLVTAQVGRSLVSMVDEFESRRYLTPEPHSWGVRITPLFEDAVYWKVVSGWPKVRERESRTLQIGEIREGNTGFSGSIISAPAIGGQLVMYSGGNPLERNMIYVTGLVSPQTGDPQAELEILAKSG